MSNDPLVAVRSDTRAALWETLGDPTLSITYDKAEVLPMPLMIDHTPWPTMKRFLEHQALAAGRKRLEDLWS